MDFNDLGRRPIVAVAASTVPGASPNNMLAEEQIA